MTTKKEYDRNNNDTYVELLGNNPYDDTHIHMFRREKGSVANHNYFGDFSVESQIKAANNVLHFPTAKDLRVNDLIKIKDKDLNTLYPLSMVNRYNLNESNLTYKQRTPIFYDKKANKFVVLLDYRFVRDICAIEKEFSLDKKLVKLYPSKKENFSYLGMLFDTMTEVGEQNQAPFQHLLSEYKNYKMTLQTGEKVIVLRYKTLKNHNINLLRFSFSNTEELLGNAINTQSFDFEYSIAVRFGTRYYLCDKEGNILQKTAFHFNKEKEQTPNVNSQDLRDYHHKIDENAETYIVPFSTEQYDIVKKLADRLNSIHLELAELFRDATDINSPVDKDVLSLPNKSVFKMIEQKYK